MTYASHKEKTMSLEQTPFPRTAAAQGLAIDAGLQRFMQGIYKTMTLGLVLTGLTAFGVASSPALIHLFFNTPLSWVVMLAPFGFLLFGFTPRKLMTMDVARLSLLFSLFSVTMGISLASIFLAYTGESVARVFFISAATFAGTSLYGYTTKRDLTGVGSFLFMGLIGIFIASIVNMFMHSTMIDFVVSYAGVAIFTGLAAWDTQRLKLSYQAGQDDMNARVAISGALSLYLDFLNLFMMLLRIMGDRR